MEATDVLTAMLTDLLIENSTMKGLLKDNVPNLDVVLRNAKANRQRRQKIEEELIIPLRGALGKEADLDRMMQRIAEGSDDKNAV